MKEFEIHYLSTEGPGDHLDERRIHRAGCCVSASSAMSSPLPGGS